MKPVEHRISDILLPVLLGLLGATVVGSWIGAAAGWPVNSLLSAEGLRWAFSHAPEHLFNAGTAVLWLLLTVWGAVRYTGFDATLRAMLCRRPARPVSQRQRHALWAAAALMALWALVLLAWCVLPHGVLLSAMGRIYPSPFTRGLLPAVAAGLLAALLFYGMLSNRLRTKAEVARMFYHGVSCRADWLCLYVLASLLYACIRYMAGIG